MNTNKKKIQTFVLLFGNAKLKLLTYNGKLFEYTSTQ